MDSSESRGKGAATVFTAIGCILTLLNLSAVALAVYAPLRYRKLPEDALFLLEDGAAEARMVCIVLGIMLLLAVLQLWLVPRLIVRMVDDTRETETAEKAMRWAYRTSYVTIIVCVASLAIVTRTFRNWADALRQSR